MPSRAAGTVIAPQSGQRPRRRPGDLRPCPSRSGDQDQLKPNGIAAGRHQSEAEVDAQCAVEFGDEGGRQLSQSLSDALDVY